MTTAALVPTPEPPMSEVSRVANVFFAPTKTFRDINRSAMWWMPFLIIVVVSYAFIAVVEKKVGFDKVAENQMKQSPKQMDKIDALPSEQRAQQMAIITKFTKYGTYAYPVIALVILGIMALLLWGSYSFGAGAQIGFGKSMAVVMYGNLVTIVKALLAIMALLAGADTDAFTFQNPVATSPAYFIDATQHPVPFALGAQFDLTSIWACILVAIGFTCVTKVKRGTSYAIVFGWFFLLLVFSAGMAALRS
jgi:hypothetical protein